MDSVLRPLAIYFFLLLLLRLSGRRTMGEMTAFDFVLLLIIGEATQQALLGDNFSITNAFIVIATLIGIDMALALLKGRNAQVERLVDGSPVVIVQDGKPLMHRMKKERVDVADILAAARKLRGIGTLSEIQWAVLEADGHISIVPYRDGKHEIEATGIDG